MQALGFLELSGNVAAVTFVRFHRTGASATMTILSLKNFLTALASHNIRIEMSTFDTTFTAQPIPVVLIALPDIAFAEVIVTLLKGGFTVALLCVSLCPQGHPQEFDTRHS